MNNRSQKKKNIAAKVIIALLSVVIIVMAGGMIYWQIIKDKQLNPNASRNTDEQVHKDIRYILVGGLDESKILTDVLMMVCWDVNKDSATIMQIPRDTYIGDDIPTGKINAVYGHPKDGEQKPIATVQRIKEYFGLPVNHYMFITLDAFVDIVDTLGGIEVDVTQYMYYEGVDIYPGTQVLDGKHAEVFMRFRKGYSSGDAGRVSMQRRFYAGLAEKLKGMSISQIIKVYDVVKDDLITDMTYDEIKSTIKNGKELEMENVDIFAVPGESYDDYHLGYWNALYTVHKDELVKLINGKMLPYSDKITADSIKIEELANTGEEPVSNGGTLDSFKNSTNNNSTTTIIEE